MEYVAVLGGLALGIYCWWLLIQYMKRNGSRWWMRHGVGWLVGPVGTLGVMFAMMAFAGATIEETGEALGFSDAISGLTIATPLLVPLAMLWWGARGKPQSESRPPEEQPLPLQEHAPQNPPTPRAPSKAAQTLAQLKAGADRLKQDYHAELARQKQKASEKEAQRAARISSPGNLKFIYEDAEGNVSTREVKSWTDDGEYIEGYCLTAGAVRTFRRDRVLAYLAGEELLGPPADDPDDDYSGFRDYSMEVLFTGLPASDRADLEDLARDHGMTVRSSVTKNLGVLVTGPRAGPSKLNAAREQGCLLLTPSQFERMLETGEVPA